MPKKKEHKSILSLSLRTKLFFISGFFLISIPTFFYTNETIQLTFFTPQVPIIVKKYAPPTQVIIPAISLSMPIKEEAIRNGGWEIAENAISYLNTSARPGEKGPIILYGHNTNDSFGPIRWLTPEKEIILKTSDGKMHTYNITKTEDVSPSQINLLTNVTDETLILYTCDGFADLQRFLVFAVPTKN